MSAIGFSSINQSLMTNYTAQSRPSAPPDSSQIAEDLAKNLDIDGSGSLSQEELQTAVDEMDDQGGMTMSAEDLFSALDSDGDGSVTQSEFATTLQTLAESRDLAQGMGGPGGPGMGGMPPPPPPPASDASSSDSDTTSSQSSAADTNGDGEVSLDELVAYYTESSEDAASDSDASDATVTASTNNALGAMVQKLMQSYGQVAQSSLDATSSTSVSA